ncbi:MAG: ABC transporter permease [Candidatus Dormibacteria bacterium]
MTSVAAPVAERISAAQALRWAVSDSLLMAKRSLLVWMRVPAYLVFTVVQPVIFVLLFRYVFGGAIPTREQGGYVNYLMPGIIGQTAAFATFATAIALAQEAKSGVIDRLRSLPMARSAVLAGRLMADSIRMMITILVIVGVGYGVGFRFQGGTLRAIAMVLLAEAFGVSIACVAAAIGLAIKDEESVQAFGLIWLFPLTFVSSAFVQTSTMPGWMRAFADHQPVTLIVNAMRSLADPAYAPLNPSLWQGLLWLVGIVTVFAPLAVRAYKRA